MGRVPNSSPTHQFMRMSHSLPGNPGLASPVVNGGIKIYSYKARSAMELFLVTALGLGAHASAPAVHTTCRQPMVGKINVSFWVRNEGKKIESTEAFSARPRQCTALLSGARGTCTIAAMVS